MAWIFVPIKYQFFDDYSSRLNKQVTSPCARAIFAALVSRASLFALVHTHQSLDLSANDFLESALPVRFQRMGLSGEPDFMTYNKSKLDIQAS